MKSSPISQLNILANLEILNQQQSEKITGGENGIPAPERPHLQDHVIRN